MGIPKSFNDFTVGQFISWHEILKEKCDVITREYKLLAMLLGISKEAAEAIPRGKVKEYLTRMNRIKQSDTNERPKKYIVVKGKIYRAILDFKALTEMLNANQYTVFKEYTKEDPIKHMNKLLALLYCPIRPFRKHRLSENQERLAQDFMDAKVEDVYGAVFFYAKVWEKSTPIIQTYFDHQARKITKTMEEISGQASGKPMAGTTY